MEIQRIQQVTYSATAGAQPSFGKEQEPEDTFTPGGDGRKTLSIGQFNELFEPSKPEWEIPIREHGGKGFCLGPDGSLYLGINDSIFDNKIVRLDPATGEKLWEKGFGHELDTYPAVINKDGTVYVCTTDSNLHALDPATGREMWSFDMKVRGGAPVLADDGTLISQYKDDIYSLKPDGRKNWRFRINDYMHSVDGIARDGTVYAASNEGLYAIKPSGYEKWFYQMEKPAHWQERGSCSVAPDGNIYYRFKNHLARLDSDTGREKWKIPIGESYFKAGRDGTLLCEEYRRLRAFDPESGKEIWSRDTPGRWLIRAVDRNGALIVGSDEKKILAIDPKDGHELWSRSTEEDAQFGSARITGSGMLFVEDKKNIYGINPQNGDVQFHYRAPDEISRWSVDEKNGNIIINGKSKVYAIKYGGNLKDRAERMIEAAMVDEDEGIVEGPGFVVIGGVKLETR